MWYSLAEGLERNRKQGLGDEKHEIMKEKKDSEFLCLKTNDAQEL